MLQSPRRGELALLVLSLVLGLVLAEVMLRFLAPAGQGTGYDPVRTDRQGRAWLNAKGYRDLERAIPRPAGVRRMVCIGDSFTWGASVLADDAWPQRVERTLSVGRGEAWEAINLAEPGLNAVQEASRLASEGFAYDPDIVVVGYVLNDSEAEQSSEARRAAEWAEAERRGRPPSLLDHSALAEFLRGRIRATVENHRRIQNYRSMYRDDDAGWTATRRALKAMGGLCRERGVPLVVAIFPLFGNRLDDGYPFADIHAKVTAAAAAAGAQVVDLLPFYRGLDWRLLVVDGANDEHPNEIAHRIAARAIARSVAEAIPPAVPTGPPVR